MILPTSSCECKSIAIMCIFHQSPLLSTTFFRTWYGRFHDVDCHQSIFKRLRGMRLILHMKVIWCQTHLMMMLCYLYPTAILCLGVMNIDWKVLNDAKNMKKSPVRWCLQLSITLKERVSWYYHYIHKSLDPSYHNIT